MIATLNGKLIIKELNYVVVECGGVGIKCFVTQHTHSTVGNIGDNVFLYTYLVSLLRIGCHQVYQDLCFYQCAYLVYFLIPLL